MQRGGAFETQATAHARALPLATHRLQSQAWRLRRGEMRRRSRHARELCGQRATSGGPTVGDARASGRGTALQVKTQTWSHVADSAALAGRFFWAIVSTNGAPALSVSTLFSWGRPIRC